MSSTDLARLKAAAQESSIIASLLAVATAAGGLVVGLGIMNAGQAAVLVATTTPAVALGGVILNAVHTGSIEPSAILTAFMALVVQVGADLVAFLPGWGVTVELVIPVVAAVSLVILQVAHGLVARKVTLLARVGA